MTSKSARFVEATAQAGDRLSDSMRAKMLEVKPKLRGWIHAVTAPVTLFAGVVLVVMSPTAATRVGSAVFMASALLLFSVSGIYHRGTWGPRTWAFLRRFDHANIFILIAGSYTPFTLLLLEGSQRIWLLTLVWVGALSGMAFRILWTDAPRWLYVPIYGALGWAAIFFAGDFAQHTTPAVMAMIVIGGGLYTVGGLVYGIKKPNPFPSHFGFHEVFHSLTIAAFTAHYVGVSMATYALR